MINATNPARAATVYARTLGAAGGRLVHSKDARARDIHLALYEAPPYDLRVAPITVARLSINLRTVAVTGRIGEGVASRYTGRRCSLYLTPAGADAAWRKDAPSRHLNIYFDPCALDESGFARRPLVNGWRPALRPWIDALELAMLNETRYVDDAAIGLARAILSTIGDGAVERAAPVLAPRALARLRDYVLARLAEPIRVADLAAEAGMAHGRFVLAFKATTGQPPHRYVIERRLDHARALLLTSRLGLAEVAIASGFASQQHMTTLMRRVLGKTPAQLRREL